MNPKIELLKIGAFAKLANTNLRTLRYYEEMGLLRPALRSEGGFRYYRPTDLNRIEMIRNLQDLGLQLEQIADLLDTRGPESERGTLLDRVQAALTRQEELIDERVRRLRNQKSKIVDARAKLADCATCRYCPVSANNFCEPCQNTGRELPEFLSALF